MFFEYKELMISIIIILIGLILVLYFNFLKIKTTENNKLSYLFLKLEAEREASIQLRKIPQEIKCIEQKTQQKLQNIKVEVLNVDFSLLEIFNAS